MSFWERMQSADNREKREKELLLKESQLAKQLEEAETRIKGLQETVLLSIQAIEVHTDKISFLQKQLEKYDLENKKLREKVSTMEEIIATMENLNEPQS
jgi:chromosome segregation ATPase